MKIITYLLIVAALSFGFKTFYESDCINFVGENTYLIHKKKSAGVESSELLTDEYIKRNVGSYYSKQFTLLVMSIYEDESSFEYSSSKYRDMKINACKKEVWTDLREKI